MPLTSGSRIGAYEVLGLLGAGGMGEVYRAHDRRLGREAALKVLPPGLLADPARRARFEREARVLASLNHPNIAGIYGVEEFEGPEGVSPVLALEFVEGETLADRIAAGRLTKDEALVIARQVAEALEAAHDRGIIHRDLKPANVQITPDGTAKVLDFGLAKVLAPEGDAGASSPAHSPTITSATLPTRASGSSATELGVILGTAAYMSPEQARGRAVDRRADIWAFGAVLFECLSGVRAFPGETISDTIAAILTGTPDWARLPADTPSAIRALLVRCLERDPRERLQSIGEARITLSRPLDTPASVPSVGARRRMTRAVVVLLTLTGAAAVAAAGWFAARAFTSGDAAPARRVDLAIDALMAGLDRPPAISPDGTRIAYVARGLLRIRSTTDFTEREVAASERAQYVFWSPDGTELAFVQDLKLFRARADGGAPQLVGAVPPDMTGSGAGTWTTDGDFLLVGSDTTGITRMSARDGSLSEVVALDRTSESDFHEISQLPDGRSFLVTSHTSQAAETIFAFVDGRRHEVLRIPGENLRSPQYHPAGYLIFARETIRRGIWAVPFSLDSLRAEGEPFLVEPNGRMPSVARDGTIMIVRNSGRPSELVWIDRAGSQTLAGPLTGQVPEHVVWPTLRLSPDEQRVALGLEDELWVYDLRRGSMVPLTRGVQRAISPTWLPDGNRLLFAGFVGTRAWSVHLVSATGTNTPQRVLPQSPDFQWPTSVTPDGRSVIYGQGFSSDADLWIAPLDQPDEAKPLLTTPANERQGYLSPDGRWLAYLSDESGRHELYLRRYPIGADRELLSRGGASSVNWTASSQELLYRGEAGVMSVRLVEKDGRLDASIPQRLFDAADPSLSRTFAVTGDGQRFLFARATSTDQVSLILNWSAPAAR